MELINATNINLHNGSKDILIDGSFQILDDECYGLIGPNGVGKTTLIRILLNEEEIDKGTLKIKKGLKIGYLPQMPEMHDGQTIEDFLLANVMPYQLRLAELETLMAEASSAENSLHNEKSPHDMENLLNEYQHVLEQFEAEGSYEALDRGISLLGKLGLDNPIDQLMNTLSGGEQSLIFFARALLSDPDLLILDEPGNHLDYLGLAWLEMFLASYKNAVIIVTHNRYLLDKTCKKLLDMKNGKLTCHTGDYSSYRLDSFRVALNEQSEYEASRKFIEKQTKKIKQLQSICMSQYNPSPSIVADLAAAKKKLSQELSRNLQKPDILDSKIKLNFGEESSKSHIALQVNNFNWKWGDREIFKNTTTEIHCGEKVALVGLNGSGKTTLISAILENHDWSSEVLRVGPSQKIGYLSQQPQFSKDASTVEEEIRSWGPIIGDEATTIARNALFTYKDLEKPLAVLSGGEKNRLQLAHIMYDKKNFLILDEPTNHMDIGSRELIEKAISNFMGTVLVVSHDRYFLDQLVTRVIEINDQKLISYDGNFSDFFKEKYPVLPRLSGKIESRSKERSKKAGTKNTQTLSQDKNVHALEERIEQTEQEKRDLEKALESCYSKNELQKGRRTANKLEQVSSRLENLYKKWEEAI